MFSTSLVAAVVTGLAASASVVGSPTMQPDYRTALVESAKLHKPVAVFIGHGNDGYSKLVTNGGIGADAATLLNQSFISVYLDTTTEAGRKLASEFNLSEGLVISDKTGGVQNLRHEGTVAQADLKTYLVKYADGAAAAQTETRSTVVTAPVVAPTYNPYRTFVIGGGNGGCATGNCPLRR